MSDVEAHAPDLVDGTDGDTGRPRIALGAGGLHFGPRLTLRNVLVSVFYYRRLLVLAFLVPVIGGIYTAMVSKPIYSADEKLLVLMGSEYVYQPEVGQAAQGAILDRNQIMQSELEILESQYLRVATVRAIGLARIYPDLDPTRLGGVSLLSQLLGPPAGGPGVRGSAEDSAEAQAAERLRQGLSISAVPQTNVIQLAYRTTDRNLSAEVLNTLVSLYFERRSQVLRSPRTEVTPQQDKEAGQRVRDAEDALTRFSDAHRIASFDEQLSRLLDQQAATMSEQLRNEQEIKAIGAQLAVLRTQLASIPPTVEIYADTQRAATAPGSADDLVKLESQLRSYATRYQPNAPQMVELQDRVARARGDAARGRQLEAQGTRRGQNPDWLAASGRRDQLQVDQQGALARRDQLRVSLAAVDARITELNNAGAQYRDLKRQRDVLADAYRTYSHNEGEAQLAEVLDSGRLNNIRVVQPATPPASGSARRAVFLAGGVALGLVLAGALLVVLNVLRETLLSVEDVERHVALPVLAAAERKTRAARRRMARAERSTGYPAHATANAPT